MGPDLKINFARNRNQPKFKVVCQGKSPNLKLLVKGVFKMRKNPFDQHEWGRGHDFGRKLNLFSQNSIHFSICEQEWFAKTELLNLFKQVN